MEPSTSANKSLKDSSIPYILNGELYQILTQQGDNVTVRCCSCPSDRVYRGSVRSTGNFHMHIKRRHPELLGKLHEMKVGSLLERRERLINAKKLAIRGRIKKENFLSGEVIETTPNQCQSIADPIDYSRRDGSHHSHQPEEMLRNQTQSPMMTAENEPQILIATEVHCDLNANMGIQRNPVYFSTVKEELSTALDEQAIDLSIPNKRTENSLVHQMVNLKWEQVLQRVECSLQNIQEEMRTRNQIETNRIFLDLAKFKYLNPGFRYQS